MANENFHQSLRFSILEGFFSFLLCKFSMKRKKFPNFMTFAIKPQNENISIFITRNSRYEWIKNYESNFAFFEWCHLNPIWIFYHRHLNVQTPRIKIVWKVYWTESITFSPLVLGLRQKWWIKKCIIRSSSNHKQMFWLSLAQLEQQCGGHAQSNWWRGKLDAG